MSDQPEVLSISVAEDIKIKDVPPGGASGEIPAGEVPAYYLAANERRVSAHNVKSRWITSSDISLVVSEAEILLALCKLPHGHYQGTPTLAHTQINDKEPLRFFVMNNGVIVVNPLIINHTKVPTLQTEGCIAYSSKSPINLVPRFNKITVTFQTIIDPDKDGNLTLSAPVTEEFNGRMAQMFQHECSHLNGANIYDEKYQGKSSIGFGDGLPVDPKIWVEDGVEEAEIIEK